MKSQRKGSAVIEAVIALSLALNGAGILFLLRARPHPAAALAASADGPSEATATRPRLPDPAAAPMAATGSCAGALQAAENQAAELRATVARTGAAPTAYRWTAPDAEQTGRWQAFLGRRARELGLDDGSVTGDCHEQGCKLVATAEAGGSAVTALERLSASAVLRACCVEIARGPSRAVRDALGGRPTVVAEYYVRLRPEFDGR